MTQVDINDELYKRVAKVVKSPRYEFEFYSNIKKFIDVATKELLEKKEKNDKKG